MISWSSCSSRTPVTAWPTAEPLWPSWLVSLVLVCVLVLVLALVGAARLDPSARWCCCCSMYLAMATSKMFRAVLCAYSVLWRPRDGAVVEVEVEVWVAVVLGLVGRGRG